MTIITGRPWFTIGLGARVNLPGLPFAVTVLARPTAETAVFDMAPHFLTVDPTSYVDVIEPDYGDAIVALFLAFPGAEFIDESEIPTHGQ